MSRTRMHEHLASRVREALAEDPRLNVLDVEVRIVGDAMHLHGELSSAELIEVAERIAHELAPELAIINRLSVCQAVRSPDHERIR